MKLLKSSLLESTPTFENPVTGERYEVRDHTRDVLRLDYYLAPGGFAVGKVDHAHPRQEESIEVRAGRLGVRIDGDEWSATPGTQFAIPPKTAHTVWNAGNETVHAVVELEPSLDILSFFETMAGLGRDGQTNGWGLPGPLQLAVVADEFSEEIYFPMVPMTVQRLAARALARVARSRGYRAR